MNAKNLIFVFAIIGLIGIFSASCLPQLDENTQDEQNIAKVDIRKDQVKIPTNG